MEPKLELCDEMRIRREELEKSSIGQKCDCGCGRTIRTPWVVVVPPMEERKKWFTRVYATKECGGSWFVP
jgi:hypothetical protein